MASTRKVLERVPEDKFQWKAHPKSNSIGWVTRHLAEIPGWIAMTMDRDALDLSPPGGPAYEPSTERSLAKILDTFDDNVSNGRRLIGQTSDGKFAESWTLLKGGQTLLTMSKYRVVRLMVLNHLIHHRAHLLVYLRMNEVPVPGLYGPSGDEDAF